MKKIILALMCLLLNVSAAIAQDLVEELSEDEVTIILKGDYKQSGRMINYEPGKSITIVTAKGDTLTYQQSEVYRIQRKRPHNLAFTSEFGKNGPQRGYHGEYNYEMMISSNRTLGFSTVQGFQIFPWLRLGAGYTYLRSKRRIMSTIEEPINYHAVYGDVKVFFTRSIFSPFVDMRLGSSLNKEYGFCYNVSVGCRFGLKSSKRFAFNFAMGVTSNAVKDNYDNVSGIIMRAGFEF